MSQQPSTAKVPESKVHCLFIISGDPRVDEAALEGIRCAVGLAGDSRWKVTVGFCEDALSFVRDFTDDSNVPCNPILKQWGQSSGNWYCFSGKPSEKETKPSVSHANMLDASAWLQLGMLQAHIFCFGRSA